MRRWLAIALLALCGMPSPAGFAAAVDSVSAMFAHVEPLRFSDHPRFVEGLARLRAMQASMTPAERWHLRYLEAWEDTFTGNYAHAQDELRTVAADSGDPVLATKSNALLLSNLAANRQYGDAFALANRLVPTLPTVKDAEARWALLFNLSQMFVLAEQTDLALRYAGMLEPGTSPQRHCAVLGLRIAALSKRSLALPSSNPAIGEAIDACVAADVVVTANMVHLVRVDRLLDEGRPEDAIAELDGIDESVRMIGYNPHLVATAEQRARALEALGRSGDARRAALAGLAHTRPGDVSEWLKELYGVLYRVEKARGNNAAALRYFEAYAAQDKGYLNDITARNLAFELSTQHAVLQKLETERLVKANNILLLQKELETSAVAKSRLFILLLLCVVGSVVLWLFRLKRSQMRFRKLSQHDGLTGVYNRQHFMSEAARLLPALQRRRAPACLVFIDLDHFKQINDTHGHAIGDAVLRRAAALCRGQLGPHDLFGRLGGEEFAVLFVDRGRDDGVAAAEAMRACMEASPVIEDGHIVTYACSAGLAATDSSGYDLQDLCRDADKALYRAKRAGRNRVSAEVRDDRPLTMRSG
ncbi:GGDEF domain-containing protein [Luteibacter sp. 3190]|uniref:GGDEF domain-containing protein n=1 Tax=Luteibacter sp. 3190 TaxID=2817736 RepID=UPI00285B7A03|nr:GGDEF domain-containing protein [Luteibacter sp. 3190]MDR6935788.1 diguanylate cyclase (GGDEF)-like protein [Luteibacter sp. 3190]